MQPIEIYQLDDTNRILVYPELEDLTDLWEGGTNIISLETARGYRDFNHGDLQDSLANLVREIESNTYKPRRELEEEIITRISRAGYESRRVTLQGYSQGEWADVIIYGVYDLASAIKEVKAIWRGDVYCLAHERAHLRADGDGETLVTWDVVDSIGWIVADDEKTIKEAINDHFGLVVSA